MAARLRSSNVKVSINLSEFNGHIMAQCTLQANKLLSYCAQTHRECLGGLLVNEVLCLFVCFGVHLGTLLSLARAQQTNLPLWVSLINSLPQTLGSCIKLKCKCPHDLVNVVRQLRPSL